MTFAFRVPPIPICGGADVCVVERKPTGRRSRGECAGFALVITSVAGGSAMGGGAAAAVGAGALQACGLARLGLAEC